MPPSLAEGHENAQKCYLKKKLLVTGPKARLRQGTFEKPRLGLRFRPCLGAGDCAWAIRVQKRSESDMLLLLECQKASQMTQLIVFAFSAAGVQVIGRLVGRDYLPPPRRNYLPLPWGPNFRSRPGKPNQRKGQTEKFMNFAHSCEFWCFPQENKHDSH